MKRLSVGAVIYSAMALACLAVTAHGGTLPVGKRVDFASQKNAATVDQGGKVSYKPGMGNTFSVVGAPISWVQQGPSDLFFAVTGGYLDLTTGGCTHGCSFNNKSLTHGSEFADGGSIKIFGTVIIPGIPSQDDPTGLLFSGIFNSTGGSKIFGHAVCPITNVTLASAGSKKTGGIDGCVQGTLSKSLLQYLNFPPGDSGKGYFSELEFNLTYDATNGWNGKVNSSDVDIAPSPAPEPSTLLMFGSALLVGAALVRRKYRSHS